MAMNFKLVLASVMGCVFISGVTRAATPPPDKSGKDAKSEASVTAIPAREKAFSKSAPPAIPATPVKKMDPPAGGKASNVVAAIPHSSTTNAEPSSASPSAGFVAEAANLEGVNPYAIIGDRNIFHLNPPPPPPDVTNNQPPPNIKITGIIKHENEIKALFMIPPKEAKDAATYVCLSEGEQDGVLQLVKIFQDKEECDVVNAGIRMTLSFKNNSMAPAPPKLPGPGQGMPPPPIAMAQPQPQPQPQPQAQSSSSVIVAGGQSSTPQPNAPANAAPNDSGLRQIPTRQLRLTPQGNTTVAEQSLVMAATYASGKKNADGSYVVPSMVVDQPQPAPGGSNRQRPAPTVDIPPPLPDWEGIASDNNSSGPPAVPQSTPQRGRLRGRH